MNTTKNFVVKRSTWHRGHGCSSSKLLRSQDQTRCCLGHVGQQCGISDAELSEVVSPISVGLSPLRRHKDGYTKEWEESLERWPSFLIDADKRIDSSHCVTAMAINDNTNMREPERERKLTEIFSAWGYTLTFED